MKPADGDEPSELTVPCLLGGEEKYEVKYG